jgi:hypothetical protein
MTDNIELVQWLYNQKCDIDSNAFSEVCQRGKLDMLEIIYSYNCKWDKWSSIRAACCGHINILKYLHFMHPRNKCNGCFNCPWSEDICMFACTYGQLEVLKWLISHKYNWSKSECIASAQHANQQHMVDWILSQKTETEKILISINDALKFNT